MLEDKFIPKLNCNSCIYQCNSHQFHHFQSFTKGQPFTETIDLRPQIIILTNSKDIYLYLDLEMMSCRCTFSKIPCASSSLKTS